MHHALLIPDVRSYIFAFVKEDTHTSRRTFAMLARTCKALSEPSLDALWSELHSLRPLASCIYMANTMSVDDESPTSACRGTEPDLSIFHKYARRVRKLDATFLPMRTVRHLWASFNDDLGALLYYEMPPPLLPNLRHLACAPGTSLNLLRHLLNPYLLSLKIPNCYWVSGPTEFSLTKIPGLCPRIKSLTLEIQCLDQLALGGTRESTHHCISRVISHVVRFWKGLELLDCGLMTTESILRLPMLSYLRILRLQVTTQTVADLPADSLLFPFLHTLHIKSDAPGTAITVIRAMKALPSSLKIDFAGVHHRRGACDRETVELLLRLVGDASHNELRNFSMISPHVREDHPWNLSDMLQPLFPCCELRTLFIQMLSPFTLNDDNLRVMATAWPRLEALELIDQRRPRIIGPTALDFGLVQPAPAAGPVVAPPHPQPLPPMQPQPPTAIVNFSQPQPSTPAAPTVTPSYPHPQPQPFTTTVGFGQPHPPTPALAAGPTVTPSPPLPLPQPSITANPDQPILLPQTTPLPAAGPAQPLHHQPFQPVIMYPPMHHQPHTILVPAMANPTQLNQPLNIMPHPMHTAFQGLANPLSLRTAEVTFHGLISLLELCPNLDYFDLAIDATKLDGLQGHNPGGGVRNPLIKAAKLLDSPIGDPRAVADILLDILPEIRNIFGLSNSSLASYQAPHIPPQGWFAVHQIIQDSRQARTQPTGEV